MGVRYNVTDDGTITDKYWEPVKDGEKNKDNKRKHHRIELVGVVCDANLAAVQGIRYESR